MSQEDLSRRIGDAWRAYQTAQRAAFELPGEMRMSTAKMPNVGAWIVVSHRDFAGWVGEVIEVRGNCVKGVFGEGSYWFHRDYVSEYQPEVERTDSYGRRL